MAKRKDILNASLKALLAGAETSAAIKIPATFISELASLPDDKQNILGGLSQEQFNELLIQSELSALNAADAAVSAEQTKALVQKLTDKALEMLKDISEDVKYIRETLSVKVTVFLEGNFSEFKKEERQLFIDTLASILKVKANQIRILKVLEGSIQIILEMPNEAAELFLSLFLAGDENVANLNIKKVLVQEKEEDSSTKQKEIKQPYYFHNTPSVLDVPRSHTEPIAKTVYEEKISVAMAIDARDITSIIWHLRNLIPLLERRSIEKRTVEIKDAKEIEMWGRLEEAFHEGKFDIAYIYALNIQRKMRSQNN